MDIVNEDDEVVGRDTRSNVHARHELHRGVHVFVVSTRGELLLQRRSENRSYYPGCWDASAGGQVAAGESYELAARRELAEELGRTEGLLELVGKYNSYSTRQREKRALFTHISDGPFLPSQSEIAQIVFASPGEIARRMDHEPFTEGFRRSFALWRSAVVNG